MIHKVILSSNNTFPHFVNIHIKILNLDVLFHIFEENKKQQVCRYLYRYLYLFWPFTKINYTILEEICH